MRKDLGVKPYIYPQPVLVLGTYDKGGRENAMTAAWGGMYDDDLVYVCLGEHKSTENIRESRALTISIADKKTVKQADYVGTISFYEEKNKLTHCGLTPIKSSKVNAPYFEEFLLTLECELVKETESGIIAKIINVMVDDKILNKDGKIDMKKFAPIAFDSDNREYYEISNKVG